MKRILFVTALLISHASAQAECKSRWIAVTIHAYPGSLSSTLTSKDVELKVDGRIVRPKILPKDKRPLRLILLLDVSGSAVEGTVGKHQREFLSKLIAAAPTGTEFAFVTFATNPRVEFPLGTDKSALELVIAAPTKPAEPRKTAIYDAILASLKLIPDPRPGDAIYLLTDGADNASQANIKEVRRKLLDAGVRLFVALAGRQAETVEEIGSIVPLKEIAEHSGGAAIFLILEQRPSILSNVYLEYANKGAEEFLWTSIFDFEVFDVLGPPGQKIQIRIPKSGKVRKRPIVLFPRETGACH